MQVPSLRHPRLQIVRDVADAFLYFLDVFLDCQPAENQELTECSLYPFQTLDPEAWNTTKITSHFNESNQLHHLTFTISKDTIIET